MAEKEVFVAGDETQIAFDLVDADTGLPITDALAANLIWRIGSGTKVTSTMTITGSEAKYTFTASQLVKGMLKFQVRIRDATNRWFTSHQTYSIEVLDSL